MVPGIATADLLLGEMSTSHTTGANGCFESDRPAVLVIAILPGSCLLNIANVTLTSLQRRSEYQLNGILLCVQAHSTELAIAVQKWTHVAAISGWMNARTEPSSPVTHSSGGAIS